MNFKQIAAAAGVTTAGVALIVAAQGSAQAAPAQPVAPAATAETSQDAPQAIGSLVGKAAKAATKAANKAAAVGKGAAVVAKSNADNMLSHGSLLAEPEDLPQGVATDTVFDR